MGSTIVEFYADVCSDRLKKVLAWGSYITPSQTLQIAFPEAFESIKQDITDVNNHLEIDVSCQSDFYQVQCPVSGGDYDYFYVFEFNHHTSYTRTTTTKMEKLCTINESLELQMPCVAQHNCHVHYFPYFYSNVQCTHYFRGLKAEGMLNECDFPKLQNFAAKSTLELTEDDWTK